MNIPQQDLTSALAKHAKEATSQLVYSTQLTEGKTSRAIKESTWIKSALNRLLAPPGLRYEILDVQSVMMSSVPESTGSPPSVSLGARDNHTGGNALRLARADAPASSAAQTSAPPLPEVTVTAPRPPTPEELAGDAVSNFVRVHAAPAVVSGQLARWGIGRDLGICPLTTGLSSIFNDFVSARILAVAGTVGAPFQAGRCSRHNVYVVFATDPKKALDAMVKQDSRILGFHYPEQTRDLERVTHPIQGWYVTTTRGWHGDESVDEAEPVLPLATGIPNQGRHPAGLPGSRLSSSISSGIVNVIIVADANKMVGRPIGAIADYIAMLTLTQAFASERCGTLPSIMDLMVPDCGEKENLTGVTAGDLAFLRALYKTDMELFLPLERSAIHNNMMQQFERR